MIASVSFGDGPKLYDYFTDLKLRPGDLVVVPAGDFFSVARVMKLREESTRAEKWVAQKVDLTHYKALLAMEEMFA